MFQQKYAIIIVMKEITKTLILKISLQKSIADGLVNSFTQACNYVAENSERVKRRSNAAELQKEFYYEIRERFGLPSQYAVSVFRVVSSKFKTNKNTKPIFKKENPQLQLGKDFSIKNNKISINTLQGRIKNITFSGSQKHTQDCFSSWNMGGAKLYVRKNKVYLAITFSKQVEIYNNPNLIGVDMGMKNVIVTSEGDFFNSENYKLKRNHYRKKRAELQSKKDTKNTRGIRRVLKRLSRKESSLTKNEMHKQSKNLVKYCKSKNISKAIFEDLSGIKKSKRNHGFSFHMLSKLAEYKLNQEGIDFCKVDPSYTSQQCSKCGHTEKKNRNKSNFKCLKCGYSLNADLNAAKNIKMKYIVLGQVPQETGESQHAHDVFGISNSELTSQRVLTVGS